jgi:hypothetical protein
MGEGLKKLQPGVGTTGGGRRPTGAAPAHGTTIGRLAAGLRWSAAQKKGYNTEWALEKNGFRSPRRAREAMFEALVPGNRKRYFGKQIPESMPRWQTRHFICWDGTALRWTISRCSWR